MRTLLLLFISVGMTFSIVSGQPETPPAWGVDALSEALSDGRYLDAYHAAFGLSDSAPASVNDALASNETPPETRVFLLLFSLRAAQALIDARALPESATALAAEAAANEILGQSDEADRLLPLALSTAADDAQVFGLMAAAAFVYGSPERMSAFSGQALDLDPALAGAYRLRGLARSFTGDLEGALADAEQAVVLDSSIYFFHYMRVGINFALENPVGALEAVDSGLALRPNSFIGRGMRSGIGMAMGDFEQSARDFAASVNARAVERAAADVTPNGEQTQIEMAFGRGYEFSIAAETGQILDIAAVSVIPYAVDPMILLLDPKGKPVAFNDDGETTIDAAIADFAVLESGTYTLLVSHANGGSEGAVVVTVTLGS